MTLMREAIPAPAVRRAAGRGLIQRCGGIRCPPGTCDHTDDPADAVHRSADPAAASAGAGVPASVLRVLDTPGTPLDASVRSSMEARLGHDFGRVRVHTDNESARSARDIGAAAYTFGRQVVMGAGHYQPDTLSGSRLLAHELAHVVQQRAWPGSPERPTTIGSAHEESEREADEIAGRTAAGAAGWESAGAHRFRYVTTGTKTVARQPLASTSPEAADTAAETEGPEDGISESMPGDDLFEQAFESGEAMVPADPTALASLPSAPGIPLASFITPGAQYALALTPGLVSGGGYTPAAGLLATEALAGNAAAAQAAGTAEALLAAQGLTTSATALAEGTTLAEGLTAAGEGILVFEAAGGAEAEAVIPVAGWIVGAIVLVAAGGLLAAGYLLRKSQQQKAARTQSVPQEAPRVYTDSKTGDCTEERHDALQAEVERHCKVLPRSCRPGMSKAQLKRQAFRNWRCARARDRMNNECYGGAGDPGHQRAAQLAWEAYWRCWELYHQADRSR